MSKTKVVNMRDYQGDDLSTAERRNAEYFGRIAAAATAWVAGQPLSSAIRCRRRPQRTSCAGHLQLVRSEVPAEIRWRCTCCAEEGVITGWQGCAWELAPACPPEAYRLKLVLEEEHYRALCEIDALKRASIIARATSETSGIGLGGSIEELKELLGAVQQTAQAESNPATARSLARVVTQLEEALAREESEGGGSAAGQEAWPKMSETLLEFAKPALELFDPQAPLATIKGVLMVASAIWNAIVLEQWGTERALVAQVADKLRDGAAPLIPVFEALVERKRRLFNTDLRAIGDFEVQRSPEGALQMRVEAYLPQGLHRPD